jgi:tetratricopeptide (TPR) repeat protein
MKKSISWIMTIGAVVLLCWVCGLFIESRDVLKWPQTKGHVISSTLTITHLPQFLNFSDDPLRWYGTDVQYEYTVGDGLYTAHRVAIRDSLTQSSKSALKIMNKYRHQSSVIVFYNPSNPGQAILEPANIGDIFVPLLCGGLLVFLWFITFFNASADVVTLRPNDSLHWGNVYQQQGKLDQALNEYNKIIHTSPYLAIGYVSRGSVYLQQGRWELAILDFNKAIVIDPVAAIVYFNRANAYLGNKQYDKAWEDMHKAMEMGFKVKPEILERIKKNL